MSTESIREDRAIEVRSGEELESERLRSYLEKQLGAAGGDFEVRQFPSGYSNLTYLVRLAGREYVLRRPPFGTEVRSAHDMGREYRILAALGGVFGKVPKPILFCDDPAILGDSFYLMERVRGVILRPGTKAEDAPEPARMTAIADSLLDTLAELHSVDYAAAGLGELGRPEGYVGRQVAGWSKRYANSRTDDIPEMESVARWLDESQPAEAPGASGAALIHNDFKYDNLILDPETGSRAVAVLDWEMATLGDPLMDLGTTLGYWLDPDDPPQMQAIALSATTLPGNPTRSQVAERYAKATGCDLGSLVFYYAYGTFKIGVILQQIYYRYRQGLTSDPRFEGLIDGVRGCATAAARSIEKGRIDRLF